MNARRMSSLILTFLAASLITSGRAIAVTGDASSNYLSASCHDCSFTAGLVPFDTLGPISGFFLFSYTYLGPVDVFYAGTSGLYHVMFTAFFSGERPHHKFSVVKTGGAPVGIAAPIVRDFVILDELIHLDAGDVISIADTSPTLQDGTIDAASLTITQVQ